MSDNKATSSTEALLQQLRQEATEVAHLSGQAVVSFAWTWPIRGILYTIMRKHSSSPLGDDES